jgi:cystathionine beta-lyase
VSITFDFDTYIDRRDTGSIKWDKYKGSDIIPLWVADMDFCSPPAVIDALQQRIDHGIFGYTSHTEPLVETVVELLEKNYQWRIEPDWIVWLPGLVTGINVTCRAVGEDGDAVITNVPVYPPFLSAPGNFRRELITFPLVMENDRWAFDFEDLEKKITPNTKLFLLCSPHNPAGRVFTREELFQLISVCEKHNIIICSDEIHCDIVLDEDKNHIPTAALDEEIARRTITLMAPSKTYNIPGLGCSFAVIPDENLRNRFSRAMAGIVPHVNALGYTAALAAYRDGHVWLAALLDYLRKNRDIVTQAIHNMQNLSMTHVEATYLAWIDARPLKLQDPAKFFEEAGVGLADGSYFNGQGFVRLNFGCSRATLEEALMRMRQAVEKYNTDKTKK